MKTDFVTVLATPVPAASVNDVELTAGVPALRASDGPQAWLLVRLHTEPLGMVVLDVPEQGRSADTVLEHITAELAPVLEPRMTLLGLTLADLDTGGVTAATPSQFLAGREQILRSAPECTVVICTRDRPEGLRTTLASLVDLEYPAFEVVVVDSASVDDRTRAVATDFVPRLNLRYLRSEVPGLSKARNLALAAVSTPVVAWLDDDATADRFWLAEIARGFAVAPGTVAVSGVVVPRTLRRREQVWFEQFGGHSKGRGFTLDVFAPATNVRQSPLYPLPLFGVGANMAFHTAALRSIGGFDEALGAGTRTKAGEDTKAFTQVMLAGGTMVYQPTAIVRHEHRDTVEALRAQLDGYGIGLTAYYLALLMESPTRLFPLLKLMPAAWRDLRDSDSLRVSSIAADFPPELLASNLRSMLRGPGQYLRQHFENRRGR